MEKTTEECLHLYIKSSRVLGTLSLHSLDFECISFILEGEYLSNPTSLVCEFVGPKILAIRFSESFRLRCGFIDYKHVYFEL